MANSLSDRSRLAALRDTGLLDEPPSEALERLTRLATRLLGVPISVVSLIEDTRQFYAANTGVGDPWASQRGSPLSHSFCKHVVESGEPLIVEDARAVPLLKDNLAIPDMGIIAYAGIPLGVGGECIGTFCAVETRPKKWSQTDIESLKTLADAAMAELNLREANRLLAERERELVSVLARKDELIGLVSHELRSPLTSISGALKLMEAQPAADPKTRQLTALASRGTNRLIRLVDDLLDIERAESGELALDLQRVSVNELFGDAEDATHGVAEAARVHVRFDGSDEIIVADRDRIVQVIVNLIGNAVKFSPPDTTVVVSAARCSGVVRFSVRDQGRGIPADKLEVVFERFRQIALEDGTKKKGAGLGLAICRAIVSQHGGRIWAENNSNGGAVFRFELPAQ